MTSTRTLATALVAAPLLACLLGAPALAAGSTPSTPAVAHKADPRAAGFCKVDKKYLADVKTAAGSTTRSGVFAGLHTISGDLTAVGKQEQHASDKANEVKLSAFYGHLYNTGKGLSSSAFKAKLTGQTTLIRSVNSHLSAAYTYNCV